ncbi:MAG: SufS family cysteine desulfurase [Verrucomicrobia bacterium]|nr:SufS family cysteine desulfurase [Verrucomicrobiota bacterium]
MVNRAFLSDRTRQDFPILHQSVNGHPLVYLDNAASTQRPGCVIEEISRYYREDHANVHRGLHALSTRATQLYEAARTRVARFLNAAQPASIVFTRGTTESINLVAASWVTARLRPGEVILTTEMEHHANLIPWQIAAQRTGAQLKFLPVTGEDGAGVDWDRLERLLDELPVRFLAFTHISNSLGCVNPIARICQAAKKVGVITLVDAAQSAGHSPLDVQAIDCDFLAFSGHKCCGPTGIGVLYGKSHLLEQMEPYQVGGEMISSVTYERAEWKPAPHRFEAGTPHIAGAIGLAKALDYLDRLGRPAIESNDHLLGRLAYERLRELPGIRILGPRQDRAGIVSFQLGRIHAHDLVAYADQFGVALRGGHHCTQPLMRKLGLSASARASFYFYNTTEEIDRLLNTLRSAADYFGA